MANFVAEILIEYVFTVIGRLAYSLWMRVGVWLGKTIPWPRMRIFVGGLLGLSAFVLPIVIMNYLCG